MGGFVNHPIHMKKKGRYHQGECSSVEDMATVLLHDHIHQPPLNIMPVDKVSLEIIGMVFGRIIKAVGKVRRHQAELLIILTADPENKPSVRNLPGMEDGTVQNPRRDQQVVSGMDGVGGIPDLIIGVSLQKEIKLIVFMMVESDWFDICVTIVKDFKVGRLHMLSGIKGDGQFFLHRNLSIYVCRQHSIKPQVLQCQQQICQWSGTEILLQLNLTNKLNKQTIPFRKCEGDYHEIII